MRVLYVSQGYSVHDHRFLAAIQEHGWETHFLPLGGMEGQDRRPLPEGVIPHKDVGLPPAEATLRLYRYLPAFQRRLGETRPDLVHAGPIQRGALLAALAGFHPLVSMSWGWDLLLEGQGLVDRMAARFVLARSDAFIGDCEAVRRKAISLGMPEGRTVVFPWGVDLTRFHPGEGSEIRKRLGWERSFVMITTRAFEPLYDMDTVARGFLQAGVHEPDLRWLAVGEGRRRHEVERQIREAGLSERAHFAGSVAYDDLPDYFRAADLYVSASRVDGSSVSLLEAMASGLPALVSDIPGNREWISEGENGWLFPVGDASALAGAIIEASRRGQRLRIMGESGRAIAGERADWSVNQACLREAYALAMKRMGERLT